MQYNKNNLNKAKSLRSDMTKEEVKLWNLLRAKRFDNCKFRRQVLIGNYIVDFVCIKEKLVIELDGGQHTENGVKKYDLARTRYLESQGYKVLRFGMMRFGII